MTHVADRFRRARRQVLAGWFWLLVVALAPSGVLAQSEDLLPSWNAGPARQAILRFVADVTRQGAPTFVAPAERIAVFDNDGTLWAEQPLYFQLAFALDRVEELAPAHPEWKDTMPFSAVLRKDMKAVIATGDKGLAEIVMATHAGMSTDEFSDAVRAWVARARHPTLRRPYTQLVYQPMLELLQLLRANGFKTFIVSGGSVEFMRVWAEGVYGIPPEQVIGTSFVTRYEMREGGPVLLREPKVEFVDDGPGKPVAIQQRIGRRPLLAFGNSDGDLQMLQWTGAGSGARLAGLVHHTDAAREWAYDRQSSIGRLDRALDEAGKRGWIVVDMKRDWRRVFPFEPQP